MSSEQPMSLAGDKSLLQKIDGEGKTLWQLLEERCQLAPDSYLLAEGDGKKRKVTVSECKNLAERLAAGLYEQGIRSDMRVSWQLPTRLDTMVLILALSRLGAVQNPIIHLFREHELSGMLDQTQPEWFVVPEADSSCDYPAQAEKVAAPLNAQVIVIKEGFPQADPSILPPPHGEPNKVHWIYCTSGTTSGPKGVLHTDASLIAGGRCLISSYDPLPTDVNSAAYPVAHIGGVMFLAQLLLLGQPAVLIETFNPPVTAEAFRQHKVTIAGGSTAHYQAWLALQNASPGVKVLPDVRILLGGGASKPPQLFFDCREKLGLEIVHAFGMTESPMVATNKLEDEDFAKAYTDGKPAIGMDVRLQKADGSWAEPGEEGEVVIKGDCLCQGYINPEQTKEAFDSEGYFHTGDLAKFDDKGYISLTGRLKDIIIRKGENISAREIEELLLEYPGVKGAAVIGLPDEDRGEMVCAVLEGDVSNITLDALCEYLLSKSLMKIKLPERLELVDTLPRSQALGKIAKNILRKQFSQ